MHEYLHLLKSPCLLPRSHCFPNPSLSLTPREPSSLLPVPSAPPLFYHLSLYCRKYASSLPPQSFNNRCSWRSSNFMDHDHSRSKSNHILYWDEVLLFFWEKTAASSFYTL
ncbi:hypothetical protein CEXT_729481 [Caerostris extrusa]|uniref:Uncharacterized protein n=1 Tax=Caerostris extrusa TaxID=172846 RepID=A0AAV4W907_CAEEX|nr:hypothetical protein CEXT_729481 [Caerostris extrusa]